MTLHRHSATGFAAASAVLVAAAALVDSTGAGATALTPATMRPEITTAFGHLVGPPERTVALRPYVDGADEALASAFARGAVNENANASYLLADGTMHVSSITRTTRTTASVAFDIADGSASREVSRFVGSAVYASGTWRVSYVTACMLVEQEGVVCPDPHRGVTTPLPLPYSVLARQIAGAQSPDLLRPGALVRLPDGDLLVADTSRDQILEWHPGGRLTVFAGTGQLGFSGDGGPATHARLQRLGGMALAPDGTLYVVSGNRVRAIASDGVISSVAGNGQPGSSGNGGPAIDASLDPSDVAVARNGTLDIASGSAIRQVSPSGIISSLVAGGPPAGVDVPTAKGPMAFFPTDIAFDAAGNLDVYSSSPKEMFEVSPSGRITLIGPSYTAQLTTALDGEVLGAGHGESIVVVTSSGTRTVLDLSKLKIKGLWYPGDIPGIEPSGIAVAPSGVVYLDSFAGNGFSGGTSLVEITRGHEAVALPVHTPVLDTLPGGGAAGFPDSVYPAARPARGTDLASCPSSAGLVAFDPRATAAARAMVASFNASPAGFFGDLAHSDRSWWTRIFATWSGGAYGLGRHSVVSVGPASRDPFAAAVAHACGRRLVEDSLVVDVGPSDYSFQVSHLFVLDRRGHPLVYFQAS